MDRLLWWINMQEHENKKIKQISINKKSILKILLAQRFFKKTQN
jgi:hypothetical protein